MDRYSYNDKRVAEQRSRQPEDDLSPPYELLQPAPYSRINGFQERLEPDPEEAWKQQRSRWYADLAAEPGRTPVTDSGPVHRHGSSFWRMLLVRTVISAAMFGALWSIHQYRPAWSDSIRIFITQALNEEIDFTSAQVWYQNHFKGAPSFIPIFGQTAERGEKVQGPRIFTSPMDGVITKPFGMDFHGIELTSSIIHAKVHTVETGRVTAVSQDEQTGLTVKIQHAGGYFSVYGHLGDSKVRQGDWVEGGDEVGTLGLSEGSGSSTLYFELQKDGQFMNPAEVVPFD